MPLLYEVPTHLLAMITSDKASLLGAIIKDNATGHILGHVQQASGLSSLLGQTASALGSSGFSPLSAISVFQNEQLRRSIGELQNGMFIMQNLQYGGLALSGLGLGVSVAGFAVTMAKLRAIETQLDEISDKIGQTTKDRREDDLRTVFADVAADLQNVETLINRRDPQRVAELLQLSLARSTRRIEKDFLREGEIRQRMSISIETLERLWTLAAAMRLCQEAAIQALFAADELGVARQYGQVELDRQIELLQSISPDILSRMVSRNEKDPVAASALRTSALSQATTLAKGIKGGVLALASQVSIAKALQDEGTRGIEYMRAVRAETSASLVYLLPKI